MIYFHGDRKCVLLYERANYFNAVKFLRPKGITQIWLLKKHETCERINSVISQEKTSIWLSKGNKKNYQASKIKLQVDPLALLFSQGSRGPLKLLQGKKEETFPGGKKTNKNLLIPKKGWRKNISKKLRKSR